MDFFILFLTLFCAGFITFQLIPNIIYVAKLKSLFDWPEGRKQHSHPVPPLGGIAIFAGFFIASALLVSHQVFDQLRFLLVAAIMLVLVGLKDDLVGISAGRKFYFQIGIVSLLFYAGFRVEGFYRLLPFEELPIVLSFVLTQLFFLTLINAYNLIDGINGLAGSLSVFAAVYFALLFCAAGKMDWAIIALALTGAIAAFLWYNFNKASIFMGDTGSTFLGLILGVFSLEFLNHSPMVFSPSVSIVMGIIFIPVADLIRVFFTRIMEGKAPFSADRRHIHHIFLRQGYSTRRTCLLLVGFNMLIMIVIGLLPDVHSFFHLGLLVLMSMGMLFAIRHMFSILNTPIPFLSTHS